MNITKNIIKHIIPSILSLLIIIGLKNTLLGKYSVINHLKVKQELENLKLILKNKEKEKRKLTYKTKQLAAKKNLITHSTKKINTINKNYLVVYY